MLTFVFASAARGDLQHGDVVVAGGMFVAPNGYSGWLRTYSRSGELRSELPTQSELRNLQVHDGNALAYALRFGNVVRITSDGSVVPASFPGLGPFVFADTGSVYAANLDVINVYNNGVVQSFHLPSAPAEMDLAEDRCTLYYTTYSSGPRSIEAYDLCLDKALPPLITGLPRLVGNLRVVPWGSGNPILVGTSEGVMRINYAGQVERIYPGYMQVALDVDRHSIWTAGADDRALKVDLITGDVVGATKPETGPAGFPATTLTVVDEPRAAIGDGLFWSPQRPTSADEIFVVLEGWNTWCSYTKSVSVSQGVVTLTLDGGICGTPTNLQSRHSIGHLPRGRYTLHVLREGVSVGEAEFEVIAAVPVFEFQGLMLLSMSLIAVAWWSVRSR